MAAYLGYTLRMRTLFRGWPIMLNDTHTRRSRSAIFWQVICSHLIKRSRICHSQLWNPVIGGNSFRQSLKMFLFATYWCLLRIRGFTMMCYITLLFTYFYLLTYSVTNLDKTEYQSGQFPCCLLCNRKCIMLVKILEQSTNVYPCRTRVTCSRS